MTATENNKIEYVVSNKPENRKLFGDTYFFRYIFASVFFLGFIVVGLFFDPMISVVFFVIIFPIFLPSIFLLKVFAEWKNDFKAKFDSRGVSITNEKGEDSFIGWDQIERVAVEECGLVPDVGGERFSLLERSFGAYTARVPRRTLSAYIWSLKSGREYGEDIVFVHLKRKGGGWELVPLPVDELENFSGILEEHLDKDILSGGMNIFSTVNRIVIGLAITIIFGFGFSIEFIAESGLIADLLSGPVIITLLSLLSLWFLYLGYIAFRDRKIPTFLFVLLNNPARIFGALFCLYGVAILYFFVFRLVVELL